MEEKQIVINQITVGQLYRQREDITTWMQAVQSAESVHYPRWKRLLELYNRTVLDLVVTSSMRKRIQKITNTALNVVSHTGQHDDMLEKEVASPWFKDLMTYIMEARFWGHSVIEPKTKDGQVSSTHLIPRHHVDRVRGLILLQEHEETNAIPYREGLYANHLLEVGGERDLGLLMKIVPMVLYKQGDIADWSHFAELFGMPTRIYKYNPLDPASRIEVEKQAREQGSAAYIIVPEGVSMEFAESANATGSGNMYDGLRKAMNEEIVIGVLGNNLTTSNSDTGTYALGEVHENEQTQIHKDDLRYVEGVLNHTAKGFLHYWGIKLKNGYSFKFDTSEQLSLSQRIDLDTKINSLAPIDVSYFYDRYGVPSAPAKDNESRDALDVSFAAQRLYLPVQAGLLTPDEAREMLNLMGASLGKLPEIPKQDPPPTDDPQEEEEPDEGKLNDRSEGGGAVNNFYAHSCSSEMVDVPTAITKKVKSAWSRMLKPLYDGLLPAGKTDLENVKVLGDQLFSGFQSGFGKFDIKDAQYLATVHENLFTFAGAKNLAELKALRDLIYKNGKKIPFTEFRAEARKLEADYREYWLRAEYNQVVRAGTMGQRWRDLERTKHLYPYLRYVTEEDGRVRPEHVLLQDTIRPIKDDFWLTYYPPNGWNCRCSVRKVSQADIDSGKHELTPSTDAQERGRDSKVQDYWKGNVGKGMVFRASGHTYFKNLNTEEVAHIDKIARYWRNLNPLTREAGYLNGKRIEGPGETYTQVHIDADKNDLEANLQAASFLNSKGYNVRIQPHVISPYGDTPSNPELAIWVEGKWVVADRKDVKGAVKNAVQSAIKRASKQQARIALVHVPAYDQSDLDQALKLALSPDRNKSVEEVWIVLDDVLTVYKR